jgi:hypothetical protein
MKTFGKIIYYLVVVAVLIIAVKEFYAQRDLEKTAAEEVFGWYYTFGGYGNILISIASLLCFFAYRKHFPAYVSVCYVGMIVCVTITSSAELGEIAKKPSFWYSIKGIGTFVNFGLLFFAANKEYFNKLLKLFYYLCFFFILAGFINLSKVGFGASRTQNQYAILNFAVYLIWVFPYFFLQEEFNKRANFINFCCFMAVFLFVLATGSRSYMVIYASYFLVKFKNQLRKKNSIFLIVGMGLVVVIAFFLLSNSGLSQTFEGAFNILSQRTNEDSRSDQLGEFIAQFDLDYLMGGVGPKATWFWTAVGPYAFLDNQFLLLVWWAGLPTLLFYLFLVITAVLKKSEIVLFENVTGSRMILAWWIMACLGFAIYITISSSLYYYFLSLLMGQQFCKYTEFLELPDVEED